MVASRWRTGRLHSIHIPNKNHAMLSNGQLGELEGEGLVVIDDFGNNKALIEMVPLHLRFDT
ncbi:hypothetical protein B0H12DRAFT_1104150 [Mycena haematopus]|nr:hypothetical protein B0H12DRAFT_1104150 [Mycena haematopus]